MNYDQYGQPWTTEDELCNLLYKNPDLNLKGVLVDDPRQFNQAQAALFADIPRLKKYLPNTVPLDQFDQQQQNAWHMPQEYVDMDIAKWVLDQCATDAELQRCGEELLLYQEREAFMLLRYMKYRVDTMRANG